MIGLGKALEVGLEVLDKIIPDQAEKARLKNETIRLAQEGEFKELDRRFDAIIMEAKSSDPWTSRARPSFMYVVYIYILSAIPMGVVFAISPETAQAVIDGVTGWLASIPNAMWATFTAGYLGYAANRSKDKATILGQQHQGGLMSKIFS